MEIVTHQHSDYASVNETYTYFYDHADRLMNTTQGRQVVKIDDQVKDPTYKGVFNFMDGANEEIEYEYDKNGNLVKDLNKNISKIEYNLLNLPSNITFGDGKTITYVYDASGAKLLASYKTAHPASSHTIAYCGNMIYEDDTFKQVLFDGGYITFTGTRPMYHYYLKDHLGNNRVVVSSKGKVEQVTHYYPYGGIMAESTNESVQRYKYNGKELDRMHGLDWYDYGARWMADGRFTTIDPHAETYADVSPYAYCGGNPISAIDLNGEDEWEINSQGEIINKLETSKHDAFYMVAQNKDGSYSRIYDKSIIFDYNTIVSANSVLTKDNTPVLILQVRDNMASSSLFEFLADNTSVEWSYMTFSPMESKDGINTLSTSYDSKSEAGCGYVMDNLSSFGKLNSFTHNHPSGISIPSGLNSPTGNNDISFFKELTNKAVRLGGNSPSAFIYTSHPRNYTKYNIYSKESDFGPVSYSLDEIVVKP